MPPTADSPAFIAEIARRNAGLQLPALPPEQRLNEPVVRQRWQRWLRFGGGYDWRTLRQRMRAEGLRPSALYQPRELAVRPSWCATLERLMQQARALGSAPQAPAPQLTPEMAALPFATLLAPCLAVARERLAQHGPQLAPQLLAPQALQGLEQALLLRLGEVAGGCLLELFAPQRKPHAMVLGLLGAGAVPAPTASYDAFVQALWRSGYAELWQRWPVLARLVATTVEHWADSCAELLHRLAQDHAQLRNRFFPGAPPAAVQALEAALSDPHAGGRTVVQLRFADGARLVYKPRPMDMEAAFSTAVAWLNAQGTALAPDAAAGGAGHRVAQVWARPGYGWMEWIEAEPLQAADASAYHWRLGSLLGLLRALHGADMHLENIVAAGAQPVFVDVECLLHPSAQPLLEVPPVAREGAWVAPRAVLHMGVMPMYGFTSNNQPYDLGAIGGPPSGTGPEALQFTQPNSDWMGVQWRERALSTHHYPRTTQGWCDSRAHRHAIAQGFEDTLHLILKHREWLLDGADSPWRGLRTAQGRHLARTTWNYGTLLRGAVAPESLTDGVVFDLTFEPLHRHLALFSPGFRAMAPVEREDLRQLDVPRFGFAADRRDLLDAHGRTVAPMHASTPYEAMAAGVRALTPPQCTWESQVLAQALWPQGDPVGIGARASAHALLSRALPSPDGGMLWLGLGDNGDSVVARPMDLGLYAGLSGVAWALTAAGHAAEDPALAQSGCDTLARALDRLPAQARGEAGTRVEGGSLKDSLLAGLPGMGLDQGAAGILFALDQCARLRGDARLRARCRELARYWATGPRLRALLAPARQWDLLNGAAGLLLVLLGLAEHDAPDPLLLEGARHCGEHLLQHARPVGPGLAWAPPGEHGLSGLSHGGSGYALALAALYRATRHRPYRDAAFGALAYEATLYDAQAGNWRDLRGFRGADVRSATRCGCSWCHGAPGIALGRAALLRLLAQDLTPGERYMLQTDLDRALATTCQSLQNHPHGAVDDLCCGSAGRIDVLLECGRLLGQAQWTALAQQEARRRLEAWAKAPPSGSTGPRYWFSQQAMAGCDLSLFKGMAGWTYLQARLEAPGTTPCVLLPYRIDSAS